MLRPALAVALAAALCAAAVGPAGDPAAPDDTAIGASSTDGTVPGRCPCQAMIVPARPAIAPPRPAIVTAWRDDAAPVRIDVGDPLTTAPKTSPPA